VDAVVTTTPYYFATDASTQIRHFEAIAAYAPVPVMLYNIPSMTHNPLTAETVGQLLPNPQFIGIKDSAGEKDAFNRLLALKARRPDFCVLQGAEQLAAESVLAGADGIVPGLGNLVPGLFTDLFSAAVQGDAITATAIQDSINALWTLHTSAYWLVGLKYAASLMGFGSGRTSGFVDDLTVEQQSQIRALVEQASVAKPR
jgi:dihydrodipicolinate synthase/N-acetylneuraminate lyase